MRKHVGAVAVMMSTVVQEHLVVPLWHFWLGLRAMSMYTVLCVHCEVSLCAAMHCKHSICAHPMHNSACVLSWIFLECQPSS